MNKLTISFDTPAGVHSFTVQNGTHAQFQAAVAGVDNTRAPSFATVSYNTYNIDRDAWDSIVKAVSGNEVGLTIGQIATRVVARCTYQPIMGAPAGRVITVEQWRSLCGLADVSSGVDPAHMVTQLVQRFDDGGPWARVQTSIWQRIKAAVLKSDPECDMSGDAIASHIEVHLK